MVFSFTIDLTASAFSASPPNSIMLQIDANVNTVSGETYLFAGYLGDIADYVPYQAPVQYISPHLDVPPADVVYATANQTSILPDRGLNVQWSCQSDPAKGPFRKYLDLQNVTIHAYRDTNYGPYKMNPYSDVQWDGSNYIIKPLWHGNTPVEYSGLLVASPWLACVAYNSNFYLIGNNTGKAKNTLVVWAPSVGSDLQFIVGGYADWVKTQQTPEGDDTVVVHVRLRMPNDVVSPSYTEYQWIGLVTPNCTTNAPYWMCPDHIFMYDHQYGLLRAYDWLLPLTRHVSSLPKVFSIIYETYPLYVEPDFKNTGYDIILDMQALPQSLVVQDGILYAAPLTITMFPWKFNTTTLNAYNTANPNHKLQVPPPMGAWGTAWWTSWNMTTFQNYMTALYNADPQNRYLFSLPAGLGAETEFGSYSLFVYGGTLLSTDGRYVDFSQMKPSIVNVINLATFTIRCGLDDLAVKAWNETM
ncbi:hypothetical protein HDV00_004884 [Rhizophlyctis rosea]|nr:hypothetical protein HDV00_004884 [Rhizophlyctis rosea]